MNALPSSLSAVVNAEPIIALEAIERSFGLVQALREPAYFIVPGRLGGNGGRDRKRRPLDAAVTRQQYHRGTGHRRKSQHRDLRSDQYRNTRQRLPNPCIQTFTHGVSDNTVLHVLDPPRLRHSICTAVLNEPAA